MEMALGTMTKEQEIPPAATTFSATLPAASGQKSTPATSNTT